MLKHSFFELNSYVFVVEIEPTLCQKVLRWYLNVCIPKIRQFQQDNVRRRACLMSEMCAVNLAGAAASNFFRPGIVQGAGNDSGARHAAESV